MSVEKNCKRRRCLTLERGVWSSCWKGSRVSSEDSTHLRVDFRQHDEAAPSGKAKYLRENVAGICYTMRNLLSV